MNKTGIEYLDFTWNPIAMRCTKVSPSCDNCWHLRTADRLKENKKLPMDVRAAYAGDSGPVLVTSRLNDPLHRKRPAVIGVQFMGDLFHNDVKPEWISKVIESCISANRKQHKHTWVFLTKRPENILKWREWGKYQCPQVVAWFQHMAWMGVTAENQEQLEQRWEELKQIPASVKFLSIEPMLDEIDLFKADILYGGPCGGGGESGPIEYDVASLINWVICGCESGSKRRETKTDWVRFLKEQCTAAGVPFFLKQMAGKECKTGTGDRYLTDRVFSMPELDGKVWDQWPERK